MSCRDCETITQPPMPSLPIERGRPGPALIDQVLVAKHDDHIVAYRRAVAGIVVVAEDREVRALT